MRTKQTAEERIAELEARVATLEGAARTRSTFERDLIEAATEWARLTMLGYRVHVDASNVRYIVQLNPVDCAREAEFKLGSMKEAAKNILRADTSGDGR